MTAPEMNTLALVELADSEALTERFGTTLFSLVREEFLLRLRTQWARSSDQTRELGATRFIAILKGIDGPAQLELATLKLSRVFEEPVDVLGETVTIDFHVGYVPLASGANLQNAIRDAGLALSRAKAGQTPKDTIGDAALPSATDEQGLVAGLQRAVERGELQLYYQPKFHAAFRTLTGAEALMRWHTPEKKVLVPADFLEVAERHPIIKPMTHWAVRSAMARLARWPQSLTMAVNVSPGLVDDRELHGLIVDMISLHDLDPKRVIIEVSEKLLLEEPHEALRKLGLLKQTGVKISLGNFGSDQFKAYRALVELNKLAGKADSATKLPVDELKVDKIFITRMMQSPKGSAIVKSIVELAHKLSLRVVGEGVESEATAKNLVQLGCDEVQGFALEKPLTVEEFEKRYQLSARRLSSSNGIGRGKDVG